MELSRKQDLVLINTDKTVWLKMVKMNITPHHHDNQ